MAGGPLLELVGVGMAYAGPPAFTALRDANLRIERGERLVIIGPSGSGKSTLLNIIGLLERPTTGVVRHNGRDVSKLADHALAALRARTFGFVFQSFHMIGHRTVRENVMLPMAVQRRPRRERQARADELIELVGLQHRYAALAQHLSGGEKQRVAIARALAGDPPMLLCDEPTGNLDTASSNAVMELLTALNDRGTTVVLVTHDPRWENWGHRVLRVVDGLPSSPSEAGQVQHA